MTACTVKELEFHNLQQYASKHILFTSDKMGTWKQTDIHFYRESKILDALLIMGKLNFSF